MMAPQATLRDEHDAVLSRLSSRRSTVHFGHAAVSLLLSLIFCGTAGKAWWDYDDLYLAPTVLVGVLGVAGLAYSVTRYALGRRRLAVELAEWDRLQALRRALKLDDPSALLP